MTDDKTGETIAPSALSNEQLADLLSRAGRKTVTPEMIAQDVADGAPTNGDGTLNLINYAAWLVANSKE